MSYFVPLESSKIEFSFDGYTLLMPAITVGNIGQLVLDIFVATFKMEKVGYIDSHFVLPFAGMGTTSTSISEENLLSPAMEVFLDEKRKLVCLQQRTPIIPGRNDEYVAELVGWIEKSKFARTLILASFFQTLRVDKDLLRAHQSCLTTSNFFNNDQAYERLITSEESEWRVLESSIIDNKEVWRLKFSIKNVRSHQTEGPPSSSCCQVLCRGSQLSGK